MPLFEIFKIYLQFDVFKCKITNVVCHLIKSRTLFFAMKGFHIWWFKYSDICPKMYWHYLCRSWWSIGMIPGKVTWVQSPTRISSVYSKLFPINDLIFQFLIKHWHICSYRFLYKISDQEISDQGLCSATFIHFFILLCWFGHSKENPILNYICKVLSSGYKN